MTFRQVDESGATTHIDRMQISRRKFLQTTVAGIGMRGVPAGLLSRGMIGDALSGEQFVVVSKHATWGVFESLEEARREALLIRQSGIPATNALRCSPQLARCYRAGDLGRFVELDGLAVTPGEVVARGDDALRGARHKAVARQHVLDHQLSHVRVWFDDHEQRRRDTLWYAVSADDGTPCAVYARAEDAPAGAQVFRCSQLLRRALYEALDGRRAMPDISRLTDVHVLQTEHQARLRDDVIYRLVVEGNASRLAPDDLIVPVAARCVAMARRSRWIFGAGSDRKSALAMARVASRYVDEDFIVLRASQALARAVLANGYEIPAFWFVDGRTLRHDVERDI